MKWIEVTLETKDESVDMITGMLYDLGITSLQIVDNYLSEEDRARMYVDLLDESLVRQEMVWIKCYFSKDEDIEAMTSKIQSGLDRLNHEFSALAKLSEIAEVDDEEWANSWKKYYKPFMIGDSILIKPTWETLEDNQKDKIIIEMDPGMAFGSGTHETTSMCIRLIQTYLKKDDLMIDVGCGSGILSITAAKLNASQVYAVDIDVEAVRVTRENIETNHLTDKIKVFQGDLLSNIQERADVVVANIIAEVILMLSPEVVKVLKPEGIFITSGIISAKKEAVVNKLVELGFKILAITEEKDWVAIAASLMS